MNISVQVSGISELVAKLMDQGRIGRPLKSAFLKSAKLLQDEARVRAPKDLGRLRSSIGYKVDSNTVPLWATVGTDLYYAPYMEYGTGLVHDHPSWPRKRHVPPGVPLHPWAKRHGFESGWQVAEIIAKRGGIRPRRFLRNALKERDGAVLQIFSESGMGIEKEFER